MEATKAIVYPYGEHEMDGKKVYKYILSAVILSDKPLEAVGKSELIFMGNSDGKILEGISQLTEYKPKFRLGDLSSALLCISTTLPEDLEKA